MKVLIFVFSIFLFVGCSLKEPFLKPDTLLQESLVYSKKGEIYNSLEIKASLFATYLNRLDSKYKDGEYFVVSIFIDDDFEDPEKYGLNNKAYRLTLNGEDYISKKELKEDSELRKLVPFKNQWSHYYLVKFPKQNGVKSLVLSHDIYGSTTLRFREAM